MGNVIQKEAPYKYLRSVNTPDYPVTEWLHNPNVEHLDGIVQERYWVVDGGTVREMSDAEKTALHLQDRKNERVLEVDAKTDAMIAAGFAYRSVTFSLTLEAQCQLLAVFAFRDTGALSYPIRWNSLDDTDQIDIIDAADLTQFCMTALGTVRSILDTGTVLKDQIRAATTVAEVDAIVDNR